MYVDAIHDRKSNTIRVVERDENLNRVYRDIPANYVFYHTSQAGTHKTIFGDRVLRYSTNNYTEFTREKMFKARHSTIFESDINPIFRCLEENYMGKDTPELVLGFFDIEADFCPKRGFAPVNDPFNPITAISIHNSKTNILHTLVLPPPTVSMEDALKLEQKYENTTMYDNEADLLDDFLTIIEDIDVLSGWNSTGYDIPYIVGRITRVLGREALTRLCLWDQAPRKRDYVKFKKKNTTYDLVGRVHLDYLELYQKHNPQQLHSYRLDFVGEIEVGENKVDYEGTLDDLYKKDFDKFVEYNRQDTMLLVKIDKKKRFIELANQIAHTNAVLLKTTMGSVALIEQAITLEAHSHGQVVNDRSFEPSEDEDEIDFDEDGNIIDMKLTAVGAYVADPKVGISRQVGSADINSLYPSVLRALGMSPETLFGHIRPEYTDAMMDERMRSGMKSNLWWEGVFNTLEFDMVHGKTDDLLTVDFVDGSTIKVTGAELYDFIFNQNSNICISANGTLFRTDIDGVIPSLLGRWYGERKIMQARERAYTHVLSAQTTLFALYEDEEKASKMEQSIKDHLASATGTDEDISGFMKALYACDGERVANFMITHNFKLENGSIVTTNKDVDSNNYMFWHQRQQARKILLNSLYGALLNESMKFYDKRIGQSVTLSGRNIVRHMNAEINNQLTGVYDYKGESIVYADQH